MTFENKFKALKTKLNKADIKKFSEGFAFQVEMTDEDCGGIFYIAYVDGSYAVEPFDYIDNTAVISGSAAAVAKLAAGSVDSALDIRGNAGQVAMYAAAFSKPAAKKPAVKKPAAKKAEAAKPAAKKVEAAKPVAKKAEPVKAAAAAPAKPAAKK